MEGRIRKAYPPQRRQFSPVSPGLQHRGHNCSGLRGRDADVLRRKLLCPLDESGSVRRHQRTTFCSCSSKAAMRASAAVPLAATCRVANFIGLPPLLCRREAYSFARPTTRRHRPGSRTIPRLRASWAFVAPRNRVLLDSWVDCGVSGVLIAGVPTGTQPWLRIPNSRIFRATAYASAKVSARTRNSTSGLSKR
jgi:hypothetical protein